MRFLVDSSAGELCIPAEAAEGGSSGFGFEGGRVLLEDDGFHLFTTELLRPPIWVHTAFAHWASEDGSSWRRVGTLMRSTGDQSGRDAKGALFSPMPEFDSERKRWQLFYVGYRSAPDTGTRFLRNHAGRVIRAESVVPGRTGLAGPYEDRETVLEPGRDSQPWEGLQGVDSFFPFRTDEGWLAFYGSATTEHFGKTRPDGTPRTRWAVGLAAAGALSGPWSRRESGNPCPFEPAFVENPVVTRIADGYVAVYENASPTPELSRSFGLAWSRFGERWQRHEPLVLPAGVAPWVTRIRTPLGLLPDGDGFRVWFTGFSGAETDPLSGPKASVGMIRVRQAHESPP